MKGWLSACALGLLAVSGASGMLPPEVDAEAVELRVNGLDEPAGLDDPRPSFSWRMESRKRGAAQTAWQILVAATPEALAEDRGDRWDSGKVTSSRSLEVRYDGAPLESWDELHWKVRLWDESGEAGSWSEASSWSVGALDESAWSDETRWITDGGLLRWRREHLGFRTPSEPPGGEAWVSLDFGREVPLDQLRLLALSHGIEERAGFPLRYRIELSDDPAFRDPEVVAETHEDANPWIGVIRADLEGRRARCLRVVGTKLRRSEGESFLAFRQVEVLSEGLNLAPEAKLAASASREDGRWSLAAIHDGLGLPGNNPRVAETLRLRRGFEVEAGLRRARFTVCGLGQSVLRVDGGVVDGDELLMPGWTDVEETCLYRTHELGERLAEGEHELELTLAGGFFNVGAVEDRYRKLTTGFRPLMAWGELRLEYEDGRVVVVPTDERWQVSPGPTIFSHIYGGEDYDARRTSGEWSSAVATEGPGGRLRGAAFASPPLVEHERLEPVEERPLREGVAVIDFGQNAPIMPSLAVRGPAGSRVRMIPAELVQRDGSVDRGSSGGGNAWWEYTLRGDPEGERWEPEFFYHGARYLQVERLAGESGEPPVVESLQARVVHSDSPSAGSFLCSDPLFNRVHELVRWAQRGNMAHVLSDCPHRERLGWLEQYHLNGPSLRYGWDLSTLFRKCFHDMSDAQRPNGMVPNIAPEITVFGGDFTDSPEWGSALIVAAWQHHLFHGESELLREHFPAMRRYLGYLGSRAEEGIVDHGLGDWYDVGPKPPGYAQLTPRALTATAIYQQDAATLARIARVIGRDGEAEELEALAEAIATAFNERFLDRESGRYATGSQCAQAMPLALGIVPDELAPQALALLVEGIEAGGHAVTAGDVGYRYVLRALAKAGRSDVIARMVAQRDKPGYAWQLDQGATSLTEAWSANPRNSQNHFMLGQVVEWFYRDLVGIEADPAAPGFRHTIIRPQPVEGIARAVATHDSPYGEVRAYWEQADGVLILEATVPPNTTATVYLPVPENAGLSEEGVALEQREGLQRGEREDGCEVLRLPAGSYRFEAAW